MDYGDHLLTLIEIKLTKECAKCMDVNFRISLTDGSTINGNCLDIFCGQIELIP